MNEQLIVKNFGPIKDATVDFKRVTVFIGPTGGGKSTLAKLMTIYKDFSQIQNQESILNAYEDFNLKSYFESTSYIRWEIGSVNKITAEYVNNEIVQRISSTRNNLLSTQALQHALIVQSSINSIEKAMYHLKKVVPLIDDSTNVKTEDLQDTITSLDKVKTRTRIALAKELGVTEDELDLYTRIYSHWPCYIPSERHIVFALNKTWPSLLEEKVSLPKILLDFARKFIEASSEVKKMPISFLDIEYQDIEEDGGAILLPNGKILSLDSVASGIQSVTPLLVLLENLSHDIEQAQSFIIEEPELNLYPTAQQGLLNWLVEKCTKGENDLTITTHSPYLLAHFNTLLFAYQVAQNHPERADEIAKIVPRESWLDPKEFAAYHVEGQKENGVRSIVNSETGLISYNGLDAIASAEATEFEKLLDINAGLQVEW